MDEPRFDPLDYVSVFNRRKWWFIVPLALALIIGGLLVWKLPRTYQATTTIAVNAARLAPNLVGSAVMDRAERMNAVSQQLLSRAVLERTARLEHLDQDGSTRRASCAHPRRHQRDAVRFDCAVQDPASAAKSLSPEQKAQPTPIRCRWWTTRPRTPSGSSTAWRRCSSRRTQSLARSAGAGHLARRRDAAAGAALA
jgi:hypothetical protein